MAAQRLCLHLEWRTGDTVSATDWQPAMEKLWVVLNPFPHWPPPRQQSSRCPWIPKAAAALLMLATTLIAAKWFFFVVGGLIFLLLVMRTRKEEANLHARFGEDYRNYMQRTGRFFPLL